MQEINAASNEQSIGADQINRAIQQLDKVIRNDDDDGDRMRMTWQGAGQPVYAAWVGLGAALQAQIQQAGATPWQGPEAPHEQPTTPH